MIASRVTNTNEVGRSALIYPALDLIARETRQPLRIIEVGPSAGLNLNWHRYDYRYRDSSGAALIERAVEASLVLETELRGSGAPYLGHRLPQVEASVGLERDPVDLFDPGERLWLRALIWPERTDRLSRLDVALKIAMAYPPRIKREDAANDLLALVRSLPPGPVCILHTIVACQFNESTQIAFESGLAAVARERPLFHVSVEWERDHYSLGLAHLGGGCATRRELAHRDPHGGWLEWAEAVTS